MTTSTCWRVDPLLTNTDYSVSALWPSSQGSHYVAPRIPGYEKKPPEGKWSLRGTRAAWSRATEREERMRGRQGSRDWPPRLRTGLLHPLCTVEQRVDWGQGAGNEIESFIFSDVIGFLKNCLLLSTCSGNILVLSDYAYGWEVCWMLTSFVVTVVWD